MEYPTLFTAGSSWLRARALRRSRGRRRARGRAPVLVRHRRQQRVRGCVDGRRPQHVRRIARANGVATRRCTCSSATSATSFRIVFKDIGSIARCTGTASRATGASRRSIGNRRRATSTIRRLGTADHLQQDGVVAEHPGALARLARGAADPVHLLCTLAVQAPEAARFLRHRERSGRARPERVLRSGVPQLERVRLRHPGSAERPRGRSLSLDGGRAAIRRGDLSDRRARDL